jgi:hypothetical protein
MDNGKYIRSYNVYECCKKQMSHAEMQKHLKDVHHIENTAAMKASKTLMKKTDGLEWFEATYKWKLEDGSEFLQHIRMHKQ